MTPVASSPPAPGVQLRAVLVRLHRWAGLATAAFLFVSGITGAIIAFHHELDRALNPGVVTVAENPAPLPPERWIAAVETAHPRARASFLVVPQSPDEAVLVYLAARTDPATKEPFPLEVDQAFVHPTTGEVLGARLRGALRFDRLHLMPFLYDLHWRAHLGEAGRYVIGVVGLVWLFDCFVALPLAWPRRKWRAVKEALTVKWRSTAARVTYDLHRAGSLWTWIVLAVLAFSGVSMNLHVEVFEPLLAAVAPQSHDPTDDLAARQDADAPLAVPLDDARRAAEAALTRAGMQGPLGSVWIQSAKGFWGFGFHTRHDIMREHPGTWIYVSGQTGEVLWVRPPNGATFGDAVHDWQFPLHSGKAFGLAGRIAMSAIGLIVATLSATGVLIWWRKRRARSATARTI